MDCPQISNSCAMFIDNPSHGLLPESIAEVLRVLDHMTPGRTGRSIAAACESVSVSQANNVLRRLERIGLVQTISVPPSKQYFLNREHALCGPLLAIANARAELIEWLNSTVKEIEGLIGSALFLLEPLESGTESVVLELVVLVEPKGTESIEISMTQLQMAFQARFGSPLQVVVKEGGFAKEPAEDPHGEARATRRLLFEHRADGRLDPLT